MHTALQTARLLLAGLRLACGRAVPAARPVAEWERRDGLEPSEPQLSVGAQILSVIEELAR